MGDERHIRFNVASMEQQHQKNTEQLSCLFDCMSAELPKDISSLDLAGEESKKFTGQQFCS
jgi:hypothetical protein